MISRSLSKNCSLLRITISGSYSPLLPPCHFAFVLAVCLGIYVRILKQLFGLCSESSVLAEFSMSPITQSFQYYFYNSSSGTHSHITYSFRKGLDKKCCSQQSFELDPLTCSVVCFKNDQVKGTCCRSQGKLLVLLSLLWSLRIC